MYTTKNISLLQILIVNPRDVDDYVGDLTPCPSPTPLPPILISHQHDPEPQFGVPNPSHDPTVLPSIFTPQPPHLDPHIVIASQPSSRPHNLELPSIQTITLPHSITHSLHRYNAFTDPFFFAFLVSQKREDRFHSGQGRVFYIFRRFPVVSLQVEASAKDRYHRIDRG